MKELFKLTNTKIYFFSMFLSILYSLAEYGVSFALAYFGTVPFNLDKTTSLLVFLVIFYIVMLISYYIELRIDGKEIHNEKLDLVFVSQEVDLFDLSIRENLCLGKDIKEEEILKLFDDAGLTEWYKSLPNGLDTIVGERGLKLSAGQKQRLNIIRGILIDKNVYFFDEPTSNLDSISEQKITEMINKYLKDKTYIIVTHRPALKNLCNKHYVFENHMIKEVTTV